MIPRAQVELISERYSSLESQNQLKKREQGKDSLCIMALDMSHVWKSKDMGLARVLSF